MYYGFERQLQTQENENDPLIELFGLCEYIGELGLHDIENQLPIYLTYDAVTRAAFLCHGRLRLGVMQASIKEQTVLFGLVPNDVYHQTVPFNLGLKILIQTLGKPVELFE